MKTDRIGIRIDKETKAKLEKQAKKAGRSLSNYICWLINEADKK